MTKQELLEIKRKALGLKWIYDPDQPRGPDGRWVTEDKPDDKPQPQPGTG
jgi:hypothetical protein